MNTEMYTSTCDVEGCGKSFAKPTQEKADHAIVQHKARMHRSPDAKPARKRPYVRRWKGKTKADVPDRPAKQAMPAIGFCPCCGFNLKVLQVAMSVASRS